MRYTSYDANRLDFVFILPVHKKLKFIEEKRICPHCGTILCRYNLTNFCFSFQGKMLEAYDCWQAAGRQKKIDFYYEEQKRNSLLERLKSLGRKIVIKSRRSIRERTWKVKLHAPITAVDMILDY